MILSATVKEIGKIRAGVLNEIRESGNINTNAFILFQFGECVGKIRTQTCGDRILKLLQQC